jgi:TRAP-type C4-dicarboxylate transport system permease small subunit
LPAPEFKLRALSAAALGAASRRLQLKTISAIIRVIDSAFNIFEKYMTAIPLLVFTFVIFINVVGRYVFHNSLSWAEELSRMLNILLVYIAISAGIKADSHIGVDAFITLCVPARLRKTHKTLRIVKYLIVLVFCAISCYLALILAERVNRMHQLSAAMSIPMVIPYIILPVFLFMTSLRCLMRIIQEFIAPPPETAPGGTKEARA